MPSGVWSTCSSGFPWAMPLLGKRHCWDWDVECGAPSFVETAAAGWFTGNDADWVVWAASLFTPSSSSSWFSVMFEVTLEYLAGDYWAGWVFLFFFCLCLDPSLPPMLTGTPKSSLLSVTGSIWCCPWAVSAVSCTSFCILRVFLSWAQWDKANLSVLYGILPLRVEFPEKPGSLDAAVVWIVRNWFFDVQVL